MSNLSLSRRVIIHEYTVLKQKDRRSDFHLVKQIVDKLGYTVDQNGSNSYVMSVVKTVGVDQMQSQ